jgi:hypothetical protein
MTPGRGSVLASALAACACCAPAPGHQVCTSVKTDLVEGKETYYTGKRDLLSLAYLHADIMPALPRTQQLKVLANILAPQLRTVRQISAVPKVCTSVKRDLIHAKET